MSSDSFLCNWSQPLALLPLPIQKLTPDPPDSALQPSTTSRVRPAQFRQPRLSSLEQNIMGDYGIESNDNDYVVVERRNSAAEFWKRYLHDLEAAQFPKLPGQNYLPRPTATNEATFDGLGWESSAFRPGTFLHLAWAVLQARFTGLADVAFVTKRGHSGLMAPSRIRVDGNSKVFDVLTAIQASGGEIDIHEHGGLDAIKSVNKFPDTPRQFQTMLGIHSQRSSSITSIQTIREQMAMEETMFSLLIDCTVSLSSLSIHLRYDAAVILPAQARRLTSQIGHVLRQILAEPQATLRNISLASEDDIRDIWSWNGLVPEAKTTCIHELFMDVAMDQPDSLAIDAWDGKMTYNELDQRSEQLAHHLVDLGVGLDIAIPLCFEKSLWMSVATLGVMKAGGACVAVDMSQPFEYLRGTLNHLAPPVIICSHGMRSMVEELTTCVTLVVEPAWFHTPRIHSSIALPAATASKPVYITLGSGPKGSAISQSNAASWVYYWKDVLLAGPTTRTYDAVPPSSDMFWMSTILTLCTGGCLCVPSEDDLKKSMEESIDRFAATLLHLAPFQARKVDFAATPQLGTLFLAGELATKLDLPPHVRVLSGYGLPECTLAVTCTDQSQLLANERSLGTKFGCNTWVVSDTGELCGIGEVGELFLEGPLVGRGVTGAENSSAAFVENPKFITSGASGFKGRDGRFYKTGDLVWQQADGSLILVGRKDRQVNVQGHRVEPVDVEHHLRDLLSADEVTEVVVDLVTAIGETTPSLTAFIKPTGDFTDTDWELEICVQQLTDGLKEKLDQRLPAYMVPSRFMPCATIPKTAAGKVDRRKLREQMKHKSPLKTESQQNVTSHRSASDPPSVLETQLSQLWGQILGVKNRSTITGESNFFALGGNHAAAIRLSMAARTWGLTITVADILVHPRLTDMAEHVKYEHQASVAGEEVLNLPPQNHTSMALFPLTSFQKRHLNGALDVISKANDYLTFDIPSSVFVSDVAQIVKNLVDHFDVLRTVFIQIQGKYYQTIVPSYEIALRVEEISEDAKFPQILESIIKDDFSHPLTLGSIWFQTYLLHRKQSAGNNNGEKKLVLRIHRALLDSTSIEILSSALTDLCAGRPLSPTPSWKSFLLQQDSSQNIYYWQNLLHGGRMTHLTSTDPNTSEPRTLTASTTVSAFSPSPSGPPSTLFTTACALTLSRLTGQSDVIFGRVIRPLEHHDLVGGIENIVPVRVNTHTANSTPSSSVIGGTEGISKEVMRQFVQGMGRGLFDMGDLVASSSSSDGEEKGENDGFGVVTSYFSEPMRHGEYDFGKAVVFSAEPDESGGLRVMACAKSDVQNQESLEKMLQELMRAMKEV